MKKMFTCLAALEMMLTMVPAAAVSAADTPVAAVTADANSETFYEAKEEMTASVNIDAMAGYWYSSNNMDELVITKGSDINHGNFNFKKMDNIVIGTVRLEYKLTENGTKLYYYNFYTNDGKLWNSYYVTGELPLTYLNPSQDGSIQFLRRLFRGKVVTESGDLNLRSDTNTSSEILAEIPAGTVLDIFASGYENWYRTNYLGETGYVSAEFIKETVTPITPVDIKNYTGKWIYEVSNGNHPVGDGAKIVGTVEIKDDFTYTYTNESSEVTTGIVVTDYEQYADETALPVMHFYENNKFGFGGYLDPDHPDSIYIGNGGMARLTRDDGSTPDIKALAGKWTYQAADGNTTVDKKSKDSGTLEVKNDGTYTFTGTDGKAKSGKVTIGIEYIDAKRFITVSFGDGKDSLFSGYYRSSDEISIGNGGMARLVRSNGLKVKLSGDANCDNKVELSDAVLIMQFIANPSKYSENGTDENKITAQGMVNADCCNTGDGVTNADALAIQKYKLALLASLPEKK
ncbi:MAG: SH3 domain-containing protein [Ruminococcus sp.]|nr:SH3 domain-containing protein [Ruminococcus sp.]